jgi:methylglutamate dehydrogenase subunit D
MVELRSRCAFEGLIRSSGAEPPGVWARPLTDCGFATILARKGQAKALRAKVRQSWAIELPDRPARVAAGQIAFVGQAPGIWLAVHEAKPRFAAELEQELGDLASVVDQSGGLALLRLGGRRVLDLLAKGIFLDLHPTAFPVGAAAATNLAHVSVQLWRIGPETIDLAIPRSFAPAVAHWLDRSAAEFGLGLGG